MKHAGVRTLPGGRKAFAYALLVHVALVALIVVGVRWQARPVAAPPVIQAQAVSDTEAKKELERLKRQERERDLEARKQREQEERARQEQARLAEQKRKAEAEKKREDAERRQTEARRKKEAEQRRKAAEQGLKEQLASEERERAEAVARAEQAARAASERARIEALIHQKIDRNWVRLPSWTPDMQCVVRVRLNPTGEVIQVTVVRPSGNAAFDRSVENAVYKASPLPLPEDKGLFEHFRELELKFRPPEERK